MNKGKIALLQITPFLYTDNGTLSKENEQRLRDIDECLDELEETKKELEEVYHRLSISCPQARMLSNGQVVYETLPVEWWKENIRNREEDV